MIRIRIRRGGAYGHIRKSVDFEFLEAPPALRGAHRSFIAPLIPSTIHRTLLSFFDDTVWHLKEYNKFKPEFLFPIP
ncbi:Protein CBG27108 [Caenorhabditis briggsae]|uniref:Protein CBG27108 n=1 Tax=Caenorhabditis briggsae TaxID=6238 RepID=B6IHI3_CAEBR|nr:Protein CBG27108 [Caenorhabditis briggsae]CAR99363.1 Protein CBG27108 [Caenorhabditis briggsae]